jgi:hypothetical protein
LAVSGGLKLIGNVRNLCGRLVVLFEIDHTTDVMFLNKFFEVIREGVPTKANAEVLSYRQTIFLRQGHFYLPTHSVAYLTNDNIG